MKYPIAFLALAALAASASAESPSDSVRSAITKGLGRLGQSATSYTTHRQCFSCHHQAMSMLSMGAARPRMFSVSPDLVRQQVDFTLATFKPHLDQVVQGKGVPGGNTMAAYALAALDAVGHPADDVTAALVQYLLVRQRADGSWPALTQRPPTEGSTFTNNALALGGLRVYGGAGTPKERRAALDQAITRGRAWIAKNEPATTEDKVFLLRGLVEAEAPAEAIRAARDRLLKEQREDGSWAQLPELAGDAYATGSALAALRRAGVAATDPAYRQGIKYLLAQQTATGAWIVTTRSRPVQTFFDNGDPGGKSQFISTAATGWAVVALLETVPPDESAGRARP
jgi:N-acyl-D-amino-acid deacylase